MGKLHYGTASWSEESWEGVFYPAGTAPGDYLTYYASQFTTVEANVTYYRIPSREMVSGWDRKTPEGFTLAAKFPRSIVHAGEGPRPDPGILLDPDKTGRDVEQFLDAMDLLGPKCGPLVLQFPYFNKQAFSSSEPFFARLDLFLAGLPDRFRYAVEIRNRNWLRPELCDLLRRHRTALVLTDLHYMPHPASVAEKLDVATTDFTYGRLIGDRKAIDAVTSTFDRVVLDQSDRLGRWATLMRKLLPGVEAAYLYANNHYAGHAPETIRQLAEMIEESPLEA
jgi:uncharacterized protein YecE (DUF72 family)